MEDSYGDRYPDIPMRSETSSKPAGSPLMGALAAHEKHQARLADALSELEHRLAPVLRPQEQLAETASGDTPTTPPRSDLVAGIDESSQRLRRYGQRISALLERLEI